MEAKKGLHCSKCGKEMKHSYVPANLEHNHKDMKCPECANK